MKRLTMVMVIPAILLVCSRLATCQDEIAAEKQPTPKAVPLRALARLPVKEVTIFKDGHAFVLHEGEMPTDAQGNVIMDYLPTPVIGTFWPYCSDPDAKLTAVVASRRRVVVERTALTLLELLEANVGARVYVKERTSSSYTARILGIPARSSNELENTNPPNSGAMLPQKGNVILLRTEEGTRIVALNNIQDVTFRGICKRTVTTEEFRNILTLKLDWKNGKPKKSVRVGLVYLQKGVRWIPSYKITIDGRGNAVVKLQATLINELTGLENVKMNLVIGVPTFAFKDTPDPIALQQAVAGLSRYFRRDSQTAYAFSNAIMTQAAQMGPRRAPAKPMRPVDLGPEMPKSTKSEDLFVFTIQHVTLKKGERMVLPVVEYPLKYTDVYALDIPFAPPPEVRRSINSNRQAELARLLHAPKVIHKIRLVNKSPYPLTTAPALILRDGRILAQNMITYTAVGASSDLRITTAVNIQVKKSDTEVNRKPNAKNWHGHSYDRINLTGTIGLTNHGDKAIKLEVTRYVLGNADTADHDGVVEKLNAFEDINYLPTGGYPHWWGWYGWPSWWHHFNGIGRIAWELRLEPGKSVDLSYTWHYYWRW